MQLEKLAQGPKETVTSYISRFERIVHTEGFSITEDTKVFNFLRGLTVQARERVTLSGADSLKEMQIAALKMDVDWGSSFANRTQRGLVHVFGRYKKATLGGIAKSVFTNP